MHRIVEAHGARLVVPVPLDAQIAEDARTRRRLTPAEAALLDALVADTVASAGEVGALGVDPTSLLKPLGSTAYLPDGHLGAAGHDAVARALAAALGG